MMFNIFLRVLFASVAFQAKQAATHADEDCGKHWDTSKTTGGNTFASYVCVGDQKIFSWWVKAKHARGLLLVFAGGPGLASSPYMFALGPSRLSDGKRQSNPSAWADLLNFDLVFVDAPAHVGFSSSSVSLNDFKYSDDEYAKTVANATLQISKQFKVSQIHPVVLLGESYGSKDAVLVAARIKQLQPGFPLEALCLTAPLVDRVTEAAHWIDAFGRLVGMQDELRKYNDGQLIKLGKDLIHEKDVSKDDKDLSKYLKNDNQDIDDMWAITKKVTGVKNQHDLSPKQKDLDDAAGPFFHFFAAGKYVANHKQHVGRASVYEAANNKVFQKFEIIRLTDRTQDLKLALDAGVRVLVVTAEFDAMATIEGTRTWLRSNFGNKFNEYSVGSEEWGAVFIEGHHDVGFQALSESDLVQVNLLGSGHLVAFDNPEALGRVLKNFLDSPKELVLKAGSDIGFVLFVVLIIIVLAWLLMQAVVACHHKPQEFGDQVMMHDTTTYQGRA